MSRRPDRVVVAFTHFASKRPVRLAGVYCAAAMCLMAWQDSPPSLVAPPMALADHKVLLNDLISVTVTDEPELSTNQRVDADGKITMAPLHDKLQAAGLMPRDIEKEVSNALVDGQILVHPSVTVAILEYAERRISVAGDVRSPGQFTIAAPTTLYEALAKAGWLTPDAGPDVLLTTADSKTPHKINLQELELGTDRTLNVTLTGGEVVNVPDAQKEMVARFPAGPKVWVVRSVGHSLVYSITNPAEATVMKVIASAGGAQSNVKSAWVYRREGNGGKRSIPVPLADIMQRKADDITLQADDVLLMPNDDDANKMPQYYDTHPLTPPWEQAK